MDKITLIASIIASFSLGTVIAKWIDTFLQKDNHREERKKWIRDKQFEAFTEVSGFVLSFNRHTSEQEAYSAIAKAYLLIDSEHLLWELESFALDLGRMSRGDLEDGEDSESIYQSLFLRARKIALGLNFTIRGFPLL